MKASFQLPLVVESDRCAVLSTRIILHGVHSTEKLVHIPWFILHICRNYEINPLHQSGTSQRFGKRNIFEKRLDRKCIEPLFIISVSED